MHLLLDFVYMTPICAWRWLSKVLANPWNECKTNRHKVDNPLFTSLKELIVEIGMASQMPQVTH